MTSSAPLPSLLTSLFWCSLLFVSRRRDRPQSARREGSPTLSTQRSASPPLRVPSPLPRSESPLQKRPLSPVDLVRVGGGYDLPDNSHGARFAAYVAEHGGHHHPGEETAQLEAVSGEATPELKLRLDHEDALAGAGECEVSVDEAADTAAAAEVTPLTPVLTDNFEAATARPSRSVLAADSEVEVIAAAALRHSEPRSAAEAEHSPASEVPTAAADADAADGGHPDDEAPDYETASRDPLPPPRWLSMPPPLIPFPTSEPPQPTAPPSVSAPAPAQSPAVTASRRRMPGIPTGVEAEALKAWDTFRLAQSQRYTVLQGSSSSFGFTTHAAGRQRSSLAVLPASRPACVHLHTLANLPLSHAAASVLASGGELFARLNVSLFDGASCAFFGAVAVTSLAPLVLQTRDCGSTCDSEALYTAQLNAAVYLHTRVADARALLVCDVHLIDPRSPHVTHEAGWAAVPLVQPARGMATKAKWMLPGVTTDVALRQGAPRALLASTSQPRPPPLGFAQLSYGVHACPGFAASCGLVPPDFPVTVRDTIPGVRPGNQSLEMPQLCPLRRLAIQSVKVDLQCTPGKNISPLLAVRVTAHNGLTFCAAPVAAWLVKSQVGGGSGEHTMLIQDGGAFAALEVECPQSAQVALVWELVAAPAGSGDTSRPPPLDAPVLAWGTSLVFGGGPEDDVVPSPEAPAGAPPVRDDDPTGHLLRGAYAAHLRAAACFPLREGVQAVDMGPSPGGRAVATITFEVDDAHQLRLAATSTAAAPQLNEEPTVRAARRPRVSASCDALRRSVIDAHDAQLTELAALHAEQLRAARMTLDVSDKTLGMVAVQQARRLDALASQLRAKLQQLEQTHFDDERAAGNVVAASDGDAGGSVQRPVRAPSPPGRTQSLRVRASQRHRLDGDETGQLERTLSDIALSEAAADEAAPPITEARAAAPAAVEEGTPVPLAPAPVHASRSPSPLRAESQRLRAQASLKEGASLMDAQDEVAAASGADTSASVRERHKHDIIMATLRQGLQTLPERSASDRVRTRLAQRTFDVCLFDGLLKKIVHANSSDVTRTWRLRSSHPDLMMLSPHGDVSVQPGGSVAIAVQLAPAPAWKVPCASADGVADVLVFVNDEADTNEAVFRLRVRQK